jgi:Protein of unknown function (DUF1585)
MCSKAASDSATSTSSNQTDSPEGQDQLARALTEKLATYATGAAVQPGDRQEIEAIVRSVRDKDYGLRSLVHEIVHSRLFLYK